MSFTRLGTEIFDGEVETESCSKAFTLFNMVSADGGWEDGYMMLILANNCTDRAKHFYQCRKPTKLHKKVAQLLWKANGALDEARVLLNDELLAAKAKAATGAAPKGVAA